MAVTTTNWITDEILNEIKPDSPANKNTRDKDENMIKGSKKFHPEFILSDFSA